MIVKKELIIRRCKVLLVPEATATKYLVKIESVKKSLVLADRPSVARVHCREVSWILVEATEECGGKGD